jgi:hypothetical protein
VPDSGPSESRRGFVRRAAAALTGIAGASAVATRVGDDAEAKGKRAGGPYYTFCGHTWTTASCPHPTGLPRIDHRGYPLRAADGAQIDDLGRPVDAEGWPVSDRGQRLTDPDGRPLSPAPRSKVCTEAVADRFHLKTHQDGAWYRCCGGNVRKLVDCCAHTEHRINGDQALTGYCHKGRKVFCVQYYETKVPC